MDNEDVLIVANLMRAWWEEQGEVEGRQEGKVIDVSKCSTSNLWEEEDKEENRESNRGH